MEQFKRVKVIMLPTNQKSNLQLNNKGLRINDISYIGEKHQHLYIISDDEIKEKHLLNTNDYYYIKNHYNEWYIGKFNGISFDFINYQGNFNSNLFVCKKIIATTDTSLFTLVDCPVRGSDSNVKYILPQPSQQFIEKYIESYNKGEVINDVLVEYEWYHNKQACFKTMCYQQDMEARDSCMGMCEAQRVKINPKDNTITIKKLKDSWNREEVSNLIKLFANNYQYASNDIGYNKWIEENL